MRRKIMLGVLVAAITGAAVAVPLAASADRDHRLVIGVRVNFVSSTHAEGTFAACCAVNDNGAAQADVTAFSVKNDDTGGVRGDRDVLRFEGLVQAGAARHDWSAKQPPPRRARPLVGAGWHRRIRRHERRRKPHRRHGRDERRSHRDQRRRGAGESYARPNPERRRSNEKEALDRCGSRHVARRRDRRRRRVRDDPQRHGCASADSSRLSSLPRTRSTPREHAPPQDTRAWQCSPGARQTGRLRSRRATRISGG